MKLWLPEATSNAPEVDALILALLAISCAVLALVFGLMWTLYVPLPGGQRHRSRRSGEKDVAG